MGVSVREFARQIGKTHTWVNKLVAAGALPKNDDGTIPLEEALAAYENYKQAPKQPRGRPTKEEQGKRKANQTQAKAHTIPLEVYEAQKQERSEQAVNVNNALNKAKLADTTYKAKIRELEFKFKSGELLDKNEVAAEARWLAEQVKNKLLAIPPRVASMCEGRIAREIEEIITDAINSALSELQKCKYTK